MEETVNEKSKHIGNKNRNIVVMTKTGKDKSRFRGLPLPSDRR